MQSGIDSRFTRWLLGAGLALGVAAAAHAASGVWITENQEPAIRAGMTQSQVEQDLGRPQDVVRYPHAAGPTWSYNVEAPTFGTTKFDVNFGANGKVANAGEDVLGNG
jgi:hypothetical protein